MKPEELGPAAAFEHEWLEKYMMWRANKGADSEGLVLAVEAMGITCALGRLGLQGTIELVRQWASALDFEERPPTQRH